MRDGQAGGKEIGDSARGGYTSRRVPLTMELDGTLGMDGTHADGPGERGERGGLVKPGRQGGCEGESRSGVSLRRNEQGKPWSGPRDDQAVCQAQRERDHEATREPEGRELPAA